MEKSVLRGIILFFAMILIFNNSYSQERRGALLKYSKEVEDLGTIYTNEIEPYELSIEFENEGDEPLVITSVRGCCGTRIKDYPKQPIMPGEKAFVKIEFRLTPRAHNISRSVSVMSNDKQGMKVFRIQGEVVEREAVPFGAQLDKGSAPRAD